MNDKLIRAYDQKDWSEVVSDTDILLGTIWKPSLRMGASSGRTRFYSTVLDTIPAVREKISYLEDNGVEYTIAVVRGDAHKLEKKHMWPTTLRDYLVYLRLNAHGAVLLKLRF